MLHRRHVLSGLATTALALALRPGRTAFAAADPPTPAPPDNPPAESPTVTPTPTEGAPAESPAATPTPTEGAPAAPPPVEPPATGEAPPADTTGEPTPANLVPFEPFWAQNHVVTDLWSGPDEHAISYGPIPQWSYLHIVQPQQGLRFLALVPWTNDYAFVDALAIGRSGPPPEGWAPDLSPATIHRLRLAQALYAPEPHLWQGTVRLDSINVRTAPTRSAPIIAELPHGTPITVAKWVRGDALVGDNTTWGEIGPGLYGYSNAMLITPPTEPPPLPPNAPITGRWIDVNLTRQIATAYEGRQPVRIVVTDTGRPGWDTPPGVFPIIRRVYSETMDGSTLLALDLSEHQRRETNYRVEGVLHTQYFSLDGNALHYNYWIADWEFGIPRSHGCLGLRLPDSTFFWEWASIGTPLVIHF